MNTNERKISKNSDFLNKIQTAASSASAGTGGHAPRHGHTPHGLRKAASGIAKDHLLGLKRPPFAS